MVLSDNQRKIWMVDTTLRDGEQAPGVVFNTMEKLEIATTLARIGMDEIEAGIPAMGERACCDIRKIAALHLPCILSSWCRADQKDIEKAAACKTQGVHISFPTSSILLKTFGKDEAWVMNSLVQLVGFAKKYFDRVSVGAQDATRTRQDFLYEFSALASEAGADRLRIADTVGMTSPAMVMKMIADLTHRVPGLDLEFHGHNDLGMATANAVSAVDAGASALSVTVNGLGERAGNAPLEEVAMALFDVGGYGGAIDKTRITELCQLVARASGQEIHPSKPIVGQNVFRHESGIHCSGLLKEPASYQLFEPEKIGKKGFECVIGYHSGSAAIIHALAQQGIFIDKTAATKILSLVRQKAGQQKSLLTPVELKELYFQAISATEAFFLTRG
jgi:homocitrate synthase NifV